MDGTTEGTWLGRMRDFLLHRLFLLEHQRVRNAYLLLLGDILELAALMFYLLGPTLQLPGPIFQLYLQVSPQPIQIVQPLMLLGWSSAGSNPYIPATVVALNLVILIAIALIADKLDSLLLQVVEIYLFLVPVLLVDEVLAVFDVRIPFTKIGNYQIYALIIAAIASLATIIVFVLSLFLRGKLYRLYEIVLIAGIKFQLNRWVLLALLVLKLLVEKIAFRGSTRRTNVPQR